MALPYKKDLGKYKDIDEDEILNKLSAEELKQLETALEEMDPEVRKEALHFFTRLLLRKMNRMLWGSYWLKRFTWRQPNLSYFVVKL